MRRETLREAALGVYDQRVASRRNPEEEQKPRRG
jgi:hypothetical protein